MFVVCFWFCLYCCYFCLILRVSFLLDKVNVRIDYSRAGRCEFNGEGVGLVL